MWACEQYDSKPNEEFSRTFYVDQYLGTDLALESREILRNQHLP